MSPSHPAALRVLGSRDGAPRRRPETSAEGILRGERPCLSCWPLRISLALCAGLSSLAFVSGFLCPLSPASLRLHPDFSSLSSPFPSAASWILEKAQLRQMGTRTEPDTSRRRRECGSGQRHGRGEFRSLWKEMQESKFPAGTGRGFGWISTARARALRTQTERWGLRRRRYKLNPPRGPCAPSQRGTPPVQPQALSACLTGRLGIDLNSLNRAGRGAGNRPGHS